MPAIGLLTAPCESWHQAQDIQLEEFWSSSWVCSSPGPAKCAVSWETVETWTAELFQAGSTQNAGPIVSPIPIHLEKYFSPALSSMPAISLLTGPCESWNQAQGIQLELARWIVGKST